MYDRAIFIVRTGTPRMFDLFWGGGLTGGGFVDGLENVSNYSYRYEPYANLAFPPHTGLFLYADWRWPCTKVYILDVEGTWILGKTEIRK